MWRPAVILLRFTSLRFTPADTLAATTDLSFRTMPRPLIGITLDYGDKPNRYMLPCDYATSVERAGGIPLAIPYRTDLSLIPEILDRLDGVLFSGGDDLDPTLYG